MIRHNAAARAGGIALVIAPLAYLVAETIAALAWTNPRYDYVYNFVSDLGVPGPRQVAFKQTIDSPLAAVMNAGFITYGVLAVLAAALLLRLSAGLRPRLLAVLALLVGAGLTLVAVVPGSQHSVDTGWIVLHLIGAALAIVVGNLASILVGAFRGHLDMPGSTAAAVAALGIAGLVSYGIFMTLVSSGATADLGLFERLSIYPIAVAHLALGVGVIVRPAPDPRAPTVARPSL
jgi:hypothetical membrane protein